MLDIEFIRTQTEKVKKGVIAKGFDSKAVDNLLELDKQWREVLKVVEELRRERNEVAKRRTPEAVSQGQEIKQELKKLETQLLSLTDKYEKALSLIPNLPAKDVKEGKNEADNEVVRKWGEPKKFDFKPKDHLALGEALDIIDVERAAKVSGSRFAYLKGDAALLEFALINFAFEVLSKEGFKPAIPPVLIKVPVFHGLGYSEHMGNEDYYLVHGGDPEKSKSEEEAEYYLAGTSEHSIIPMHKDEVLNTKDLPIRYVSFSSCFRREAGSYGKDTKGILRVHQFDKVEMVSFTKPEDGDKEHEYLLSLEEKLLQALEISYQVIKMCSGDLGAPAARKYDIEAWIPSQGKYREVTSTSTCTDFQARRLNIRFREPQPGSMMMMGVGGGERLEFVHTLNGTAFAIGRTIIAILENYQEEDGSVVVPEVLRKWMGKEKITP